MDFEPNSNPNQNPDSNAYETHNQEPKQGSKSMAVTAMVFGVLAFVTCICVCTALPFGIVSIILAIIVLARKKNGKPFAITGIIISSLGIIASLVTTILMMPFVEDMQDFANNADEYIQEYQDDGTIPQVILDMCDNDEETAKQIMDGFVSSYNTDSQ